MQEIDSLHPSLAIGDTNDGVRHLSVSFDGEAEDAPGELDVARRGLATGKADHGTGRVPGQWLRSDRDGRLRCDGERLDVLPERGDRRRKFVARDEHGWLGGTSRRGPEEACDEQESGRKASHPGMIRGCMSEIALSCEGLVKRYGDVVAVNGVDLTIRAGECFGLLGPNGAGKTTTVEILEGLNQPDAGTVRVLGRSWSQDARALRERIGIQLQETQLSEKLTVLETIALFRSFYAKGLEPREVMRIVQLEEKERAWVRKLSGGQKQRLSLAVALVGDPEILFLDEPTTGLDPQARRQVWDIIADVKSRGGTVLLTTHYMEEAERLCDRIAIVDRGKVIALDTPSGLIARLGAEHVLEIETESLPNLERLRTLLDVRDLRIDGTIVSLTVREVHRAVPALLEELATQSVALTRLTTHHATLEDVFVAMTGRHLREN
jgi:ABC-2 type transport system ATP-binding protein